MTTQQAALQKTMDYLGVRDHSRYELEQKLRRLEFSKEDIAYALNHVEASGWLPPPEVLAEKVAQQLHRKKKSHMYILGYLRQKKLPSVNRDSEIEREKAKKLLLYHFSRLSKGSRDAKNSLPKKMAQFLQNRGFDRETIAKVVHETSGTSKSV